MKKSSSAVSVIGGADGPTSIFFKKNAKLTLKQKIQRAKNKITNRFKTSINRRTIRWKNIKRF